MEIDIDDAPEQLQLFEPELDLGYQRRPAPEASNLDRPAFLQQQGE